MAREGDQTAFYCSDYGRDLDLLVEADGIKVVDENRHANMTVLFIDRRHQGRGCELEPERDTGAAQDEQIPVRMAHRRGGVVNQDSSSFTMQGANLWCRRVW
ncbi:hypothetical protein FTX61_09910 [Nitriliruptoraceae bacterium ZYF776]|nr:hypothetical protein [Profundirhabdus halotolerans]